MPPDHDHMILLFAVVSLSGAGTCSCGADVEIGGISARDYGPFGYHSGRVLMTGNSTLKGTPSLAQSIPGAFCWVFFTVHSGAIPVRGGPHIVFSWLRAGRLAPVAGEPAPTAVVVVRCTEDNLIRGGMAAPLLRSQARPCISAFHASLHVS